MIYLYACDVQRELRSDFRSYDYKGSCKLLDRHMEKQPTKKKPKRDKRVCQVFEI